MEGVRGKLGHCYYCEVGDRCLDQAAINLSTFPSNAWHSPMCEQASGRGKVRWQYLTDKSTNVSLKKRNDTSLEACYRDLFREMKQLLDGPDAAMEDGVEKANAKARATEVSSSCRC